MSSQFERGQSSCWEGIEEFMVACRWGGRNAGRQEVQATTGLGYDSLPLGGLEEVLRHEHMGYFIFQYNTIVSTFMILRVHCMFSLFLILIPKFAVASLILK